MLLFERFIFQMGHPGLFFVFSKRFYRKNCRLQHAQFRLQLPCCFLSVLFFKWAIPASFSFFFKTILQKKNCRLQHDSNLDLQSWRWACWPFDHNHHGPRVMFYAFGSLEFTQICFRRLVIVDTKGWSLVTSQLYVYRKNLLRFLITIQWDS